MRRLNNTHFEQQTAMEYLVLVNDKQGRKVKTKKQKSKSQY